MPDLTTRLHGLPWWAKLALYLGVWTGVALFDASRIIVSYGATEGAFDSVLVLKLTLIGYSVWAAVAPGVVLLAVRWPISSGRWPLRVTGHLAVSLATGFVVVAGYVGLRALLGVPSPRGIPVEFQRTLHLNVLLYWLIIGLVQAYSYYQLSRRRELEASQLRASLSDARLSALRSQLHPHLLFNTLNSISALVQEDPEAAEDMIAQLSELFRRVVGDTEEAEVTVEQEIGFLQRYLAIQKIRFGDRLRDSIDVEPEARHALVPPLLLQPIVENAVQHGIAERREGGRLDVVVGKHDGRLRMTVTDDGVGLDRGASVTGRLAAADQAAPPNRLAAGPPGRPAAGVGLQNTRERLETMYGDDFRFELQHPATGGLRVLIELPFRTRAES